VVGFVLGSSSPSTSDSDAKILAWYASNSHQHRQIITFFLFLAGALFLVGFLAALRERIADVEDPPSSMCQLAFGAGIASALLWILAIVCFAAPGFTANDAGISAISPDAFRVLNDAGYLIWVAASAMAALTVWATSAVALRTGFLPRWFGWVGVLAGVLQLLAVLFLPALIFWLWVLIAAILLTSRPTARAAAVGA
jgi:hypothetical protein